mgnify:CR=1 FL=1
MALKHPSTMLDDDGNQLPDLVAAENEVHRLERLVEQAISLIGYEFSEGESAGQMSDQQRANMNAEIKAGMESAVSVSAECIRWLKVKVLPALEDKRAVRYVEESLLGFKAMHAPMLIDLKAFCRRHGLKVGV